MKKFITALIAFICLLTIQPITQAAPIDIGCCIQKKDVVVVQDTTVQASQISELNFCTAKDVGQIYSENYNNTNAAEETASSKSITSSPDFKVGWNLKGSQLIKIYNKTSNDSQNNIAAEKANLAITNADLKVGWQNYSNNQIEQKTLGAVSIGKYQEKV